jgi:hypothetical protein
MTLCPPDRGFRCHSDDFGLWLNRPACRHYRPTILKPLIISWGADVWAVLQVGFAPFPVEMITETEAK